MSLLLVMELNKDTLPLWHIKNKSLHRSIFEWQCFQTFLVKLTRKVWKHCHSKIEHDRSCFSNAKVGECFFLIPPTKAET